jgi:hypothetical protein
MCGPSGNEILAQQQEASLSTMLQGVYQDRFASQTATLQELNTQLQQLASGQTPQGFDAATLASLNTKAINTNAAGVRNAQQMASDAIAGQGGGAANPAGLQSGVQAAIRGNIAATGAANLANAQEDITLENQKVGRENLIQAISGNQTLAGIENPLPFAEGASSANEASFGMADKINQQNNQKFADIAGAVTGLATDALTFGAGTLGGAGLAGGLKALAGTGV